MRKLARQRRGTQNAGMVLPQYAVVLSRTQDAAAGQPAGSLLRLDAGCVSHLALQDQCMLFVSSGGLAHQPSTRRHEACVSLT